LYSEINRMFYNGKRNNALLIYVYLNNCLSRFYRWYLYRTLCWSASLIRNIAIKFGIFLVHHFVFETYMRPSTVGNNTWVLKTAAQSMDYCAHVLAYRLPFILVAVCLHSKKEAFCIWGYSLTFNPLMTWSCVYIKETFVSGYTFFPPHNLCVIRNLIDVSLFLF
jgi:hypothetical protein